jgi:hypothetical protein
VRAARWCPEEGVRGPPARKAGNLRSLRGRARALRGTGSRACDRSG